MSVKDEFNVLLQKAYEKHSSDLHICNGILPVIRQDGKLETLTECMDVPLAAEDIHAFIVNDLLNNAQQKDLQETGSADAGYCFLSKGKKRSLPRQCIPRCQRDGSGLPFHPESHSVHARATHPLSTSKHTSSQSWNSHHHRTDRKRQDHHTCCSSGRH